MQTLIQLLDEQRMTAHEEYAKLAGLGDAHTIAMHRGNLERRAGVMEHAIACLNAETPADAAIQVRLALILLRPRDADGRGEIDVDTAAELLERAIPQLGGAAVTKVQLRDVSSA